MAENEKAKVTQNEDFFLGIEEWEEADTEPYSEEPEWETSDSIKELPYILHEFDLDGRRKRVDRFSSLKNVQTWITANGYRSVRGKQIIKAAINVVYKSENGTALVLCKDGYREEETE